MKSIAVIALALLGTSTAWAGPAEDSIAAGREALAARDVVKAMEAFTAALEVDPRNSAAAYERGRILLVIGDPKNAVADFTTAIIGDPQFGRAYVGRAEAKLPLRPEVGVRARRMQQRGECEKRNCGRAHGLLSRCCGARPESSSAQALPRAART